jgi:hypothetical protein
MPELLIAAVFVLLVAGMLAIALRRDRSAEPTWSPPDPRQIAVLPAAANISVDLTADARRFVTAVNEATEAVDALRSRIQETADGPVKLADILQRRFGFDRNLAAAVANVAVWHFESPLAVAAIDPQRRHPWQDGATP